MNGYGTARPSGAGLFFFGQIADRKIKKRKNPHSQRSNAYLANYFFVFFRFFAFLCSFFLYFTFR